MPASEPPTSCISRRVVCVQQRLGTAKSKFIYNSPVPPWHTRALNSDSDNLGPSFIDRNLSGLTKHHNTRLKPSNSSSIETIATLNTLNTPSKSPVNTKPETTSRTKPWTLNPTLSPKPQIKIDPNPEALEPRSRSTGPGRSGEAEELQTCPPAWMAPT